MQTKITNSIQRSLVIQKTHVSKFMKFLLFIFTQYKKINCHLVFIQNIDFFTINNLFTELKIYLYYFFSCQEVDLYQSCERLDN